MEENKVAADNELLERAIAIAKQTFKTDDRPLGSLGVITDASEIMRRHDSHVLTQAIFRELVAVRDATIKKVLVYEADVAAYESYCVGRGEKP